MANRKTVAVVIMTPAILFLVAVFLLVEPRHFHHSLLYHINDAVAIYIAGFGKSYTETSYQTIVIFPRKIYDFPANTNNTPSYNIAIVMQTWKLDVCNINRHILKSRGFVKNEKGNERWTMTTPSGTVSVYFDTDGVRMISIGSASLPAGTHNAEIFRGLEVNGKRLLILPCNEQEIIRCFGQYDDKQVRFNLGP